MYPLSLVDFHDGLSLYVPDLELVKSTYEDSIIQNKDTAFPFWAKVWPSSKAMTTFLQSEISLIQSKRVLEIGSGIGLPSFSIASHVSELIISDYSSDAVELIDRNITHLSLPHVKSMHIDWNAISDDIHADVVLLSDINYNPDDFTPLLSMIQCFIAAGSTVIIDRNSLFECRGGAPYKSTVKQYFHRFTETALCSKCKCLATLWRIGDLCPICGSISSNSTTSAVFAGRENFMRQPRRLSNRVYHTCFSAVDRTRINNQSPQS